MEDSGVTEDNDEAKMGSDARKREKFVAMALV